jgi:hypothetical protein
MTDELMYPSSAISDICKREREKVLETLKKDLQTRFIPSNNQWSKGRNSGLLECCNIIDEELRQNVGKQYPRTEWCKKTYCPECPDSDTCSDSRK